jgi:hypothetical protein
MESPSLGDGLPLLRDLCRPIGPKLTRVTQPSGVAAAQSFIEASGTLQDQSRVGKGSRRKERPNPSPVVDRDRNGCPANPKTWIPSPARARLRFALT